MSYEDLLRAGFSPSVVPPLTGPFALASLLCSPPTPPQTLLSGASALESLLLAGSSPPPSPQLPFGLGLASLFGTATAQTNTLLGSQSVLSPYGGSDSKPRWIAVRRRFERFHANLALTLLQQADGITKRNSVVSCLNQAYYGAASDTDNSFFVGSWAKNTAIRPPRDVDLYFVIPFETYRRFETYVSARQSALLQEVKDSLVATFPNTDMSADGQVVVVRFESYCVEVVPAIKLTTPGQFWICDTNDGGAYKVMAPEAEVNQLEATDAVTARNLRPLIRMLKAWQAHCSVPIKSFQLELVATDFIAKSPWRLFDWFYFDWIMRDFFAHLYHSANTNVTVPSTLEQIPLGDEWQSRASSAYNNAKNACEFEDGNRVEEAGDEWQKIFGPDIPRVL